MKTLITLALTISAFAPLAACTNKTIVHEQPTANPSPTVVRENNTVIKEKSPTVTERERQIQY